MSKVWYYAKDGSAEKVGPVDEADVMQAVSSGALTGRDIAWTEGLPAWKPIRDIPELNALLPDLPHRTGKPVPDGLAGWMAFCGIAGIVLGVLSCFGCITIVTGVPLLIGGIALLGAKSFLDRMPETDQPDLRGLFLKLRTYLIMTGLVYGMLVLGALILLSFVFAAAVSGV